MPPVRLETPTYPQRASWQDGSFADSEAARERLPLTECVPYGHKPTNPYAIQTAQRIGRGEEGNLTIGFSGSAMYSRTPNAVERFRRHYPKVVVQLRELYAHEQMPLLLDGTLDIGFIRDGAPTPGLQLTPPLRERFVAVLPGDHAMAHRCSISPKQLKDEHFVLFSPKIAKLSYQRIMDLCESEGFTPEIVQEVPQWVTVSTLVAAGMGVSLAPACTGRLNIPGVVYPPSIETLVLDRCMDKNSSDQSRRQCATHLGKGRISNG